MNGTPLAERLTMGMTTSVWLLNYGQNQISSAQTANGGMRMADREKVIKGLECCLAVTKCRQCPYYSGNDPWCGITTLLEDALELLKAQEPVVPKKAGDGLTHWNACGACGGAIDPGDNYCRHCGRAVSWDG